jgi:hypothetical protein
MDQHRTPHSISPYHAYLSTPVGEQITVHLARRTAVRHATTLLPRSWAELLAPWRKGAAGPEQDHASQRAHGHGGLASQTK